MPDLHRHLGLPIAVLLAELGVIDDEVVARGTVGQPALLVLARAVAAVDRPVGDGHRQTQQRDERQMAGREQAHSGEGKQLGDEPRDEDDGRDELEVGEPAVA